MLTRCGGIFGDPGAPDRDRLIGEALAENKAIIALSRHFGFAVTPSLGTHTVNLKLDLTGARR
jgi:hypothetical protein